MRQGTAFHDRRQNVSRVLLGRVGHDKSHRRQQARLPRGGLSAGARRIGWAMHCRLGNGHGQSTKPREEVVCLVMASCPRRLVIMLWIVMVRRKCFSVLPANWDLPESLLKVRTLSPLTYWFRLSVRDRTGRWIWKDRTSLRRALNVIQRLEFIWLYFPGHLTVFLTTYFCLVLEELHCKW